MLLFGWAGDLDGVYSTLVLNYLLTYLLTLENRYVKLNTVRVTSDGDQWRLMTVRVYRALHGTAPRHLSDLLRRVADLPSRRRLRSATSS